MNSGQIHQIVSENLFPGKKTDVSLVETHISWVILTDEFAFKIKKPVRFDFLDFSTLALRHHFCQEELRLNRRLAPKMYLRVLPVGEQGIGDTQPPVLDYCLQMNRMDNSREMDKMLLTGTVVPGDLEHLASLLASFHLQNRLPADHSYQPEEDVHDFEAIFDFEADLKALKVPDASLLQEWAARIPAFLKTHAPRLETRLRNGFWVEGHGDLHSRNIFLPLNQAPVVFDCLEFNPHFRRTEVLNELAFLCMDLEYYGRKDLSEAFLKAYSSHWNCFEQKEDQLLFSYYKAYRANVRLKVALLELRQHPREELTQTARSYWSLLKQYMEEIDPAKDHIND